MNKYLDTHVEIKPIPDHKGYFVDNFGAIYSEKQGKLRVLKLWKGTNGYPHFNSSMGAKKKNVPSHIAVLTTFCGPCPSGMQACHNDGNKANANLSNLRWDTPKRNQADKIAHGTALLGSRNPAARLTEGDVLKIRRMAAGGARHVDIAKQLGILDSRVTRIVNRRQWSWLQES